MDAKIPEELFNWNNDEWKRVPKNEDHNHVQEIFGTVENIFVTFPLDNNSIVTGKVGRYVTLKGCETEPKFKSEYKKTTNPFQHKLLRKRGAFSKIIGTRKKEKYEKRIPK